MVAFVLCLVVLIAGCSSYAFLSITQQQSTVPITASEWTVYIPQHVTHPQIWLLNPDTSLNSAISFNLDDQLFSTLPDLSNGGAINGGATSDCVAVQDMLYFVDSGGVMGSYDIANSQLASVTPPIPINVQHPCLCSDGRYVFVVGGTGGRTKLQVYDPLTSSWIADVPALTIGRYAPSCIVSQENIFVFGGAGGNAQIETLNIGSPSTPTELTSTLASASWTLLDATSTADWGAIPVVCNHIDQQYIYLVGGRTGATYYDIIEAFDTDTNTIEPLAFTLNKPRYAPAAVCANEFIYVFGGRGTNTWERSNALYTPTPQPTDTPTTNVHTTAEPSTQSPTTPKPTTASPTSSQPTTSSSTFEPTGSPFIFSASTTSEMQTSYLWDTRLVSSTWYDKPSAELLETEFASTWLTTVAKQRSTEKQNPINLAILIILMVLFSLSCCLVCYGVFVVLREGCKKKIRRKYLNGKLREKDQIQRVTDQQVLPSMSRAPPPIPLSHSTHQAKNVVLFDEQNTTNGLQPDEFIVGDEDETTTAGNHTNLAYGHGEVDEVIEQGGGDDVLTAEGDVQICLQSSLNGGNERGEDEIYIELPSASSYHGALHGVLQGTMN